MASDIYHSVQEILEDVRAMRPMGGSAYGYCTAMAFKLIALDASIKSTNRLFVALDQVSEKLLAEKPTMATIHNAKWLIVEKTRHEGVTPDPESSRSAIINRADLFIRQSERAKARLGQVGSNLIEDGQTIMMHSFSQSLMSVFEQAQQAGKSFEVICTESQPTRESQAAIHHLTKLGIRVTFVLDAEMAFVMPEADWCLAGADSISIDGAVANKIGTHQLALLAQNFCKPLYVATEVIKLQRQTMEGHPIHLEQRPAIELLDVVADFEFPERIKVRHQFFDLTPQTYIRSLITEQGVISPLAIGSAWHDLEMLFDNVTSP